VQIISNGVSGIGGALTDGDGRWLATTVGLRAGTYTITAVALDRAGNRSAPSPATRVMIPAGE
jgi:hypothetical protein